MKTWLAKGIKRSRSDIQVFENSHAAMPHSSTVFKSPKYSWLHFSLKLKAVVKEKSWGAQRFLARQSYVPSTSSLKAKVRCLWHPGAPRAQPCKVHSSQSSCDFKYILVTCLRKAKMCACHCMERVDCNGITALLCANDWYSKCLMLKKHNSVNNAGVDLGGWGLVWTALITTNETL